MGYNTRLNEIISRHGFDAPDIYNSTLIHSIIIDIFDTRCAGKNVSLWGVGKNNTANSHASVILSRYILNLKGLKYLIDSSPDLQGKEFMGYPVIAPEEITKKNIQIVVIASRTNAGSIRESLLQAAPDCEYIDIYEELAKRGITISYNFFSGQTVYSKLYDLRKEYEKYSTAKEKGEALKELIAYYLKIRDFYYAVFYMNEYINNQYADFKSVCVLKEEINCLLEEVVRTNKKKKDSVLIHLIDSLRAIDVFDNKGQSVDFKLFKSYQENALAFTEAYSTGVTTYESMPGLMKGRLPFEENVYGNNGFMFCRDEIEMLKAASDTGRDIIFYAAQDYRIMEESESIEMKEHIHMSEKLWYAACDIAEHENPVFGYLYYPWELHFPLVCGWLTNEAEINQFTDVGIVDMSGYIEQQFADCKDYVDKQFGFYKELLGKETVSVFLGDHSQPVYSEHKSWPYFMYCKDPDRASHVAFFISGNRYTGHCYPELFSMLNFNRVIIDVLNGREIEIPQADEIQYQYYNVQNKKIRIVADKYDYWDYTEGIICFLSDDYLYIKTAVGKEELYKRDDKETDIINTCEGQTYKKYIDGKYSTAFPDFWTIRKGEI